MEFAHTVFTRSGAESESQEHFLNNDDDDDDDGPPMLA